MEYSPYNYYPNQPLQYNCVGKGIEESGKTARVMIIAPIAILGAIIVAIMVVKIVKK